MIRLIIPCSCPQMQISADVWKSKKLLPPSVYAIAARARLECITGNLPAIRIAGYAARSNGSSVPTVTQTGPSIELKRYGNIFEVSAIVGPGLRDGVDMVWGSEPDYGLDLI